jgi:hypothetical protein
MVIIESPAQLQEFLDVFKAHPSLVVPIFENSSTNPAMTPISVLVVYTEVGAYTLPFNHPDALRIPLLVLDRMLAAKPSAMWTLSKKALMHVHPKLGSLAHDLMSIAYLEDISVPELDKTLPSSIRQLVHGHRTVRDINKAVPLMKWLEVSDKLKEDWTPLIGRCPVGFEFLNDVIIPTLHFMEASGIAVNPEKIGEHWGEWATQFVTDGKVYSSYNPYTTVGRVSNSFGGINFSAINKKDGSREAFISRFPDGVLVLIDWESFHLRLLATLMDYRLPDEPMHLHLAKQYFETDAPTEEEYEVGKQQTFAYLYDDARRGVHIPYFAAVYRYIDSIWDEFNENGRIETPEGRILEKSEMESPSPAKLFNYMLQMVETEVSMRAISRLIPVFEGKQSKILLYTYDSILIDFCPTDGVPFLARIKKEMEFRGRYPVRVHMGKTYHSLTNVTQKVVSAARTAT